MRICGLVFLLLLLVRSSLASSGIEKRQVASQSALSRANPRNESDNGRKSATLHSAILDRRTNKRKLRIGLTCLFASVGWLVSLVHRDAALSFVIESVLDYVIGERRSSSASDVVTMQKYLEEKLGGKSASLFMTNLINRIAKDSKLPYEVRVLYIPSHMASAFTFGDPYIRFDNRPGAVICYTQGLLDALSFQEFCSVIAHECGHLLHDDYETRMAHFPILTTLAGQTSDGLWYTLKGTYYATHASRLLEQANRRKKALQRCQLTETSDVRYAELMVDAEENAERRTDDLRFGAVKSVAAISSSLIGKSVMCQRPCHSHDHAENTNCTKINAFLRYYSESFLVAYVSRMRISGRQTRGDALRAKINEDCTGEARAPCCDL